MEYKLTEKKKNKKQKAKKKKYDSISYLTGDIGLNIDHFNKCMGTASPNFLSDSSNGTDGADIETSDSIEAGESSGLLEAKRYVRRYFIKPQNIFCSNKAEILRALVGLDKSDCTIYTLNNLGAVKDTSKLMNKDVIYYYEKGILYDKNKVRVMDYDLSVKKEENRKHFYNADKAPKKEFKKEYADRVNSMSEIEEAFNLTFEDINAYGEKLTEDIETCCICGEPLEGLGNNPAPYKETGRCCNSCNLKFVIPARLEQWGGENK